jgi:hypothetical protein
MRIVRTESEASSATNQDTSVGTASNLTLGAANNHVSDVSSGSSVFENMDGEIKLKTFHHPPSGENGLQRVMDKLAAMKSSTEASVQIPDRAANVHNSISVQTSLTDLTAACNTPTRSSIDVGTQYDPPPAHLEPRVVVNNDEEKPSSETSSEALPQAPQNFRNLTGARPKNYM